MPPQALLPVLGHLRPSSPTSACFVESMCCRLSALLGVLMAHAEETSRGFNQ